MKNKLDIWQVKLIKVKDLFPNDKNPRTITTEKIKKLQKQFQSVGFYNPPKLDNDGVLIGGNQRFRALMEAGYGEIEIPVMIPPKKLTERQRKEVIITDNISDGEYNHDILANEYDLGDLLEWGLELSGFDTPEEEKETQDGEVITKRTIEIECDSEAEQEILYNRFLGEGLKCKIIVS